MFSGRVYPGAGVVVSSGEKVLMSLIFRRGHLRWELPAGIAEEDETMEETAKREAQEETFLRVQPIKAIATCWHYSNELKAGWMGIIFTASTQDTEESIPIHKRVSNVNFLELQQLEKEGKLEIPNRKIQGREKIFATGYIDWRKLNSSRIHPLHREILVKYSAQGDKNLILAMGDADRDYDCYSIDTPIYLGSESIMEVNS